MTLAPARSKCCGPVLPRFTMPLRFLDKLTAAPSTNGNDWLVRILTFTLIAWVPAQLIWFTAVATVPGPKGVNVFSTPAKALMIAIVLGPIFETQMMRVVLYLFGKLTRNEALLATCSALVWGVLHVRSESWGFHAVWSFFVMSHCFLRLRPLSLSHAVWFTTAIHAGFNLLSYALYLILNLSGMTRT